MADTLPKYRFLPWTRRGLAATIPQQDADTTLPSPPSLPARPPLQVALTVTNVALSGITLELYGPGDVIGVDPRLIVRTDPRPNVTDFEPNYFAAIEFDLPDFPWMFTPARARALERLRPWCVLIILDKKVVEPPKVNRGAPLPVVTIPEEVSERELPDLAESWAWAHVQVMSENKDPDLLEQEMASEPNLNVSRLICPRRLEPNHHYLACLVPAFDLGVQRGLGLTPAGTSLAPAWNSPKPGKVTLPLYFHWEFSTGPAGDFESLARKLTPIRASGDIGFQRMFLGKPGGGLPETLPTEETSYLKMEGVLRAPKAGNSTLNDVVGTLRAGLRKVLNLPAQMLNGTTSTTTALSPPIYGEWHLNQHTVPDPPTLLEWLRDLNLDPRARAAAGLGGEVIRTNQEDFMQVAWEQVGDVIKANELLNRARFSRDVHRRTYERHYVPLPQDRLLQLTSALHTRTLIADKTVRAQITVTSLPNASVDPALRRLASPQRGWLKSAARRGNFASESSRSARSTLVTSLSANRLKIDPNEFVPDSIMGASILDELRPPGAGQVDLSSLGIQAQLEADSLRKMKATRGDLLKIAPQDIPSMKIRQDLPSSGVILKSHLEKLQELETQILSSSVADEQRLAARLNMPEALSQVMSQARTHPDAVAFLVNIESDSPVLVHALQVDAGGTVLLNNAPIAKLAPDLQRRQRAEFSRLLARLSSGSLAGKRLADNVLPTISQNVEGNVVVALPPVGVPLPPRPPTVTLPPPVKDPVIVDRFIRAFARMADAVRLETPDPLPKFVAFGVKTARDTLIARLNPDVMVVRRVKSMIGGEAGATLDSLAGVRVLPSFDRVMVAPEIAAPMYTYLAKYDRERFLPGIGQIPPDSITLLETNPRFIEAFMVGLNYEMNRELLWREYPTDQRGTPFRKFWDWVGDKKDLTQAIHNWIKGGLGAHVLGGTEGAQIVLLLRGQLLRRYPNTMIYAWRSENNELKKLPGPNDIMEPVFRGTFDPDVSFAGFSLKDTDLNDGEGWFFVLQEQPTEPRLGFDETSSVPLTNDWSQASWENTNVLPGNYMKVTDQANPLFRKKIQGVEFARNSAHLAFITLQKPMRVAIHGKHMVEV